MRPARAVEASRLVAWVHNGEPIPEAAVPIGDVDAFRRELLTLCAGDARLVALLTSGPGELMAVVARDAANELGLLRTKVRGNAYPALATELPAAQAFEREIFETEGIRPLGHPWLKPLRRHADLESPPSGDEHRFFRVEGPGIHEVAVGPVHAGIIEPGHFRFQCAGETVLHLEIQLGYQHRGAEVELVRASPARQLALAESIAGDTAVGHALAYSCAIEALCDVEPPLRPQALRGIALELERLANHVGDLGALCNDVGYLPGASWLGRLRGNFLNLLMELSGNRYGRGLVRPGGVRFDLTAEMRKDFLKRLAADERDLVKLVELVYAEPSVASRFERTGQLLREDAEALGLVGPAARASDCDRDVRRDHPTGIYRFAYVPTAMTDSGDVMARAIVRSVEAKRSLSFLREQIDELPEGEVHRPVPALRPRQLVVSLVEGWRGEIAHVAATDADGRLAAYKIVDPSFHNWFGLAMALRGQPISDFPLCNKSFNLSYAGHDL